MSGGSRELAVARAVGHVDRALEAIGAAAPSGWSGRASEAYERRRAEALVRAETVRSGVAGILPVARAADSEAAAWRAVNGGLA